MIGLASQCFDTTGLPVTDGMRLLLLLNRSATRSQSVFIE